MMTRSYVAALGVACVVAVAPAAPALASAPMGTVTVTGTGTVSGTPDELQLSLEVSATASSVRAALDAANQSMGQVRAALTADGVADADLQTSGLNIQPQYSQQDTVTGYNADESLTAELRGLGNAGQEITDAVDAGGDAVRIDSAQLDLTDQYPQLIARARADAISDARTRAGQYAAAAGARLGDVLAITEGTPLLPVRPAPGLGTAAPVPVSAGSQQVTDSVTVTYQLTEQAPLSLCHISSPHQAGRADPRSAPGRQRPGSR